MPGRASVSCEGGRLDPPGRTMGRTPTTHQRVSLGSNVKTCLPITQALPDIAGEQLTKAQKGLDRGGGLGAAPLLSEPAQE